MTDLEKLLRDDPIVAAVFQSMCSDDEGGLRLRDGTRQRLVTIFIESLGSCCAARTLESFVTLAGFLSGEMGTESIIEEMKAVIEEVGPTFERRAAAARGSRPDPAIEALRRFRQLVGDSGRVHPSRSANNNSGLSLLAVRASR